MIARTGDTLVITPRREWQTAALCRGLPTEALVPDTYSAEVRKAELSDPPLIIQLCQQCPIAEQCLTLGKATRSSGWWGGVLLHEGLVVDSLGHFDRGGTKDGVPLRFLYEALASNTDECILWPYAKADSGPKRPEVYGVVFIDGKRCRAHRVACTLAHGEAGHDMVAKQSCDNRLCINPRHLSWTEYVPPNTKLTPEIVSEIRRLSAERTQHRLTNADIARRFGINFMTLLQIVRRETWQHVP